MRAADSFGEGGGAEKCARGTVRLRLTARHRPSGVRAPTLTVDDGSRQDGSHGGLLRQELDAVQQPCRVHALAQRHVVHRLQPRVKVHRERHQLLALHHVFGGGAPQLATCAEETEDV